MGAGGLHNKARYCLHTLMGLAAKRIISVLVFAGGWAIAAVRTTLDLIGWSTAPDDLGVAMTRVDQVLAYIASLPWWVPWGFALASTMWLMWVSWPRHHTQALSGASSQMDPPPTVQRAPSGSGGKPLSEFNTGSIFFVSAEISLADLAGGHMELELIGFNGSDRRIRFKGVSGCLTATIDKAEVSCEHSAEIVRNAAEDDVHPYQEFRVTVRQELTQEVRADVQNLPDGKNIKFHLSGIILSLAILPDNETWTLPIKRDVTMERVTRAVMS